MTATHLQLAKEWFAKAAEDELSCRAILKEGGAASTVCFLSQQIAEKSLKGLMAFFSIHFVKTHDIVQLANLLKTQCPNIMEHREELTCLNR